MNVGQIPVGWTLERFPWGIRATYEQPGIWEQHDGRHLPRRVSIDFENRYIDNGWDFSTSTWEILEDMAEYRTEHGGVRRIGIGLKRIEVLGKEQPRLLNPIWIRGHAGGLRGKLTQDPGKDLYTFLQEVGQGVNLLQTIDLPAPNPAVKRGTKS